MWRSFWRSIDRFSPQYLKYILNELRGIEVVERNNRELVIDSLQSIVEIVTYGDKHDPIIFEYFMEYQVMAEFVRVLKISKNSRIEAPLLQYLSIMIQNIENDHAIYYCLSNDFINSIIMHPFKFEGGDLASYYMSFLRAVSSKLNRDTLCLLVRVEQDNVVSFPLYSEALKFAQHGEKMIQTAVRALMLNIYSVSDDLVYQFIKTHPTEKYFSDLMQSIREQCVHLDSILHAHEETSPLGSINDLHSETEKIVDDLYYLKDLLSVGECQLSRSVFQNVLEWLVIPIFFPLSQLKKINGSTLSVVTSLYLVSRLLQVVGGKSLINLVGIVTLYSYIEWDVKDAARGNGADGSRDADLEKYVSQLGGFVNNSSEVSGAENLNGNDSMGRLMAFKSSDKDSVSCAEDGESLTRNGILSYIFSDDPSILLVSLFLLLILADSKDLHSLFVKIIKSQVIEEMKVIDALLKVITSQAHAHVQTYSHAGWILQKILAIKESDHSDETIMLFNTSYHHSLEQLRRELDGCWFDYIPDTLKNEWESFKKGLEESPHQKDPLFALELAKLQQKNNGYERSSSSADWQRMVDAVKVYVLHIHLKAFILKQDLPGKPIPDLANGPSESGKTHSSDHSSANFGSEVPLGSAFQCRIAFSNAGIRDIYVIPVARGKSGKLLLMEKHPFRTQKGVVIAIAPLPGLNPKIDDDHPTWLHLQIRDFNPRFEKGGNRGRPPKKTTNHATEGRWTLGFLNAEACLAARDMIVEEVRKQRSFIEKQIAHLLQDDTTEATTPHKS